MSDLPFKTDDWVCIGGEAVTVRTMVGKVLGGPLSEYGADDWYMHGGPRWWAVQFEDGKRMVAEVILEKCEKPESWATSHPPRIKVPTTQESSA